MGIPSLAAGSIDWVENGDSGAEIMVTSTASQLIIGPRNWLLENLPSVHAALTELNSLVFIELRRKKDT